MPLFVAIAIIVVLLIYLLYAVAHERGPGAPDVAIGYEHAWDELNFGLLWDLSGEELRDGLLRDQFIDAKRKASALRPGLSSLTLFASARGYGQPRNSMLRT